MDELFESAIEIADALSCRRRQGNHPPRIKPANIFIAGTARTRRFCRGARFRDRQLAANEEAFFETPPTHPQRHRMGTDAY